LTQIQRSSDGEIIWKHRKLVLSSDGIAFFEHDQKIVYFPFSAIETVLDIASGSDIYASDIEFTVLVLVQHVLIIPIEFSSLCLILPIQWRIQLEQQPLISAYRIDAAPRHWRAWRWNPFELPQIKLMLDDRTNLRKRQSEWLMYRGPWTLTEYTDPKIIETDAENCA
jgi:hypothetical protein